MAASSFAHNAITRLTRDLLMNSSLNSKESIRVEEFRTAPGFDKYIAPHRLLPEEKSIKRGYLVKMAQLDKETTNFNIFDRDFLESILVLDPIRKHVALRPQGSEAPAPTTKQPAKRQRIAKAAPSAAPLPAATTEDSRSSKSNNSSSSSSVSTVPPPTVVEKEKIPAPKSASASSSGPRTGLPNNFYQVVGAYFNRQFFMLEFEDYIVGQVFFAKITEKNYTDYLLDHPEDACNFTNINDKFKTKRYSTVDELLKDFRLLFNNILDKFPANHGAVKEAMILKEKFDREWPAIEQQLKW